QTGALELGLVVPANECQRRLRLPVCGSRTSITMPQWPGERSRICPFIDVPPFFGVLLELLGVLLEYVPRPTQGHGEVAGIGTNPWTIPRGAVDPRATPENVQSW